MGRKDSHIITARFGGGSMSTTLGLALQEPAKDIPLQISNCMGITETEVQFIRDMLERLLTQTAPTLSQNK